MDHPEPISKRVPEIPQCRKGFTLEEARLFVDSVMQTFHSLEDMTDLRSMYETGKQLSRLFFDCHQFRIELAEYLTYHEYPAFASKMMKKLNNMGVFKNDNIWFSSFYFYNTTWNFSEIWPDFATSLASSGLPNLLNLNIGHQPYLDNLPSKNVYYLVKASLSIMHNVARVPGNIHCFTTEAVKSALTNKVLREEEFLRCLSDLCLAYIATDSDVDLVTQPSIGSTSSILQNLVDYIVTAKASEKRRCHGFQVSELLSAISSLAVNDGMKPAILSVSVHHSSERFTVIDLVKEAIEVAAQSNPSVMVIREAEEAVRLLWNLSLGTQHQANTSELVFQMGGWITGMTKEASALPNHIAKVFEAVSTRLSCYPSTPTSPGQGAFLISYAPVNRLAAVKINERLQAAGLPVNMIETPTTDNVLAESSAVGMSGIYSAVSFSIWKKMIESTSIVVVCASEAYRLSPGCRYEVDCIRSGFSNPNIAGGDSAHLQQPPRQILPVCLQPKYKSTGWLGDLLAGQVVLDLSGRRDLDAGFENFVLQARNMYAEVKQDIVMANSRKHSLGALSAFGTSQANHVDGLVKMERDFATCVTSCTTSLGQDGNLPKIMAYPKGPSYGSSNVGTLSPESLLRIRKLAVRPEVRSWSTATVSQWLKFRSMGQIIRVTGAFDGAVLSQLASLRFWAPEYFVNSLQKELELSFIDGLRFIEALDELLPEGSEEDTAEEGNYPGADAVSRTSGYDNMTTGR